ncbi:YdaU family protein [Bradyrhizobium sp. sGM-13]|uniref:YdaU family protein n=1 Tax=Bradyrhizobium sp. sGM-13 TaxID=2831781 RepID=UPI001BCB41B3|nr:YdaU family protein [Bradyrhizobium sp. sGM-13]
MVAWYKHDIPDWMDGTEGLDDGPYRVYHVVCQLIYLNEGPIALNEKGIAGRCNQSTRAFRSHLQALLDQGKLALVDGRLANSRADFELEKVAENRENAGKGGRTPRQRSAKSRETSPKASDNGDKPLIQNDEDQAPLKSQESLREKRREEETREDKTRAEEKAAVAAARGKSVFSEGDFDLTDRILKAQGLDKHHPSAVGATYFANKWRSSGWQPDLIVATIERVMAKRDKAPNNLRYFEQAIADAHAELTRPLPQGSTGQPRRERRTAGDIFFELDRELNGKADADDHTADQDLAAGPGIILDA